MVDKYATVDAGYQSDMTAGTCNKEKQRWSLAPGFNIPSFNLKTSVKNG